MKAVSAEVAPKAVESTSKSLLELIIEAHASEQFVFLVLILCSIISWAIIAYKWRFLNKAQDENQRFLEQFNKNESWGNLNMQAGGLIFSQLGQMFCSAYNQFEDGLNDDKNMPKSLSMEHAIEDMERVLNRSAIDQMNVLESQIPFLATAPFIGLFGTVLGIINAFIEIKQDGSASLMTVAEPISTALYATAFGLAAAIPAVMFYNYFLRRIRVVQNNMETFKNDFLTLARRKMRD